MIYSTDKSPDDLLSIISSIKRKYPVLRYEKEHYYIRLLNTGNSYSIQTDIGRIAKWNIDFNETGKIIISRKASVLDYCIWCTLIMIDAVCIYLMCIDEIRLIKLSIPALMILIEIAAETMTNLFCKKRIDMFVRRFLLQES